MWLSDAFIVTTPIWKPSILGSSGSGHISSDLGPVPLFLMPSIINPPLLSYCLFCHCRTYRTLHLHIWSLLLSGFLKTELLIHSSIHLPSQLVSQLHYVTNEHTDSHH